MALQAQEILKIFAIFVLVILPFPAFAQDTCEPFQDVPVNIIPVFDEPQYDYSVPVAGIQKLSHDANHSIREGLVLGLTHYQPMMEFSTPVRTISLPDGTSCARVASADVTFGYHDVTVYIAREIPQGSCGFNEVLGHEQKHIAVNREVLQDYMPIIKERLAQYLRDNGMFREETHGYAVSVLKDKLHEILDELGNQMFAENQKRQQQVDSPDEYRRLTMVCNGQLASVALQARANMR